MANYDIVTVDWNKTQTEMWLRHLYRHNPSAKVHLIPDNNSLREIAPGVAKIKCFDTNYTAGRIIYMDTDTLITGSLDVIFDIMDEYSYSVAVTGRRPNKQYNFKGVAGRRLISTTKDGLYNTEKLKYNIRQDINKMNGLMGVDRVVHYSSGLIALNGIDAKFMYHRMNTIIDICIQEGLFKDDMILDEVALSYFIQKYIVDEGKKIWEFPLDIHWVLKTRWKGASPLIIHYHNNPLLKEWCPENG